MKSTGEIDGWDAKSIMVPLDGCILQYFVNQFKGLFDATGAKLGSSRDRSTVDVDELP
jgi:hypothetical protein